MTKPATDELNLDEIENNAEEGILPWPMEVLALIALIKQQDAEIHQMQGTIEDLLEALEWR